MTVPGAPADQQTVRRHNLSLITGALATGPASRAELSQRTGLTKATVSSLVDALLSHELVVEGQPAGNGVGRPARPVALNPDGPVALGVEINVDYLSGCVLDLSGRVRGHTHLPVDNREREPAGVIAQLAAIAIELLTGSDRGLLGVALALPGVVDAGGHLVRAPNLPRFTRPRGRPAQRPELAGALADRLGVPGLLVDNEANFGALAQLGGDSDRAGADRDFVYVSGEIGVGAGLVVGGELFRGFGGFAGELGHVVIDRDGPACGCGGRGCLEQYAGQEVLLRRAGQPDLPALEAAVSRGEPAALAAIADAGGALGVGLASLLNVVDLPAVLLGAGYARLFDALTPSLAAELELRVLSGRRIRLGRAAFGVDAAVRGAAGAVVSRTVRDPAGFSVRAGR